MCAGSPFCSGFVFTAILLFAAFAVVGAFIGFIAIWGWLHERAQKSWYATCGLVIWLCFGASLMVGCLATMFAGRV